MRGSTLFADLSLMSLRVIEGFAVLILQRDKYVTVVAVQWRIRWNTDKQQYVKDPPDQKENNWVRNRYSMQQRLFAKPLQYYLVARNTPA
jgi:hypothetical protein